MNAVRVPWSAASFLAYLGGLTILVAMLVFLSVESGENGASGLVGWSALALAVLTLLALVAKRKGRLVTAGLYALSVVAAFVVFFGALLDWFGWLPDTNVTFSSTGGRLPSRTPRWGSSSSCSRSSSRAGSARRSPAPTSCSPNLQSTL